jgi:hypothetical protein
MIGRKEGPTQIARVRAMTPRGASPGLNSTCPLISRSASFKSIRFALPHLMNRSCHMILGLLMIFACIASAASQIDQAKPMVLIYCQGSQAYGEELASIIDDDDRMDAEVLVVSDPELLKSMLYFPYVRVVVALFVLDRDDGLSEHLETYFADGGGIVGLGFAGWRTTTQNASREVFSLAANIYTTGTYNRTLGAYMHDLHLDEGHEINREVGDFTAFTQRVIMNVNRSTEDLIPPWPPGKVTVLYREETRDAPVLVVHEDKGVCVTFGGFTGDSIERLPTYFGHFTSQPEFRALLSNSVLYAWENENRYETISDSATSRFAAQKSEYDQMIKDAKDQERAGRTAVLLRQALIVGIAALVSVLAIRYGFLSGKDKGGGESG